MTGTDAWLGLRPCLRRAAFSSTSCIDYSFLTHAYWPLTCIPAVLECRCSDAGELQGQHSVDAHSAACAAVCLERFPYDQVAHLMHQAHLVHARKTWTSNHACTDKAWAGLHA